MVPGSAGTPVCGGYHIPGIAHIPVYTTRHKHHHTLHTMLLTTQQQTHKLLGEANNQRMCHIRIISMELQCECARLLCLCSVLTHDGSVEYSDYRPYYDHALYRPPVQVLIWCLSNFLKPGQHLVSWNIVIGTSRSQLDNLHTVSQPQVVNLTQQDRVPLLRISARPHVHTCI